MLQPGQGGTTAAACTWHVSVRATIAKRARRGDAQTHKSTNAGRRRAFWQQAGARLAFPTTATWVAFSTTFSSSQSCTPRCAGRAPCSIFLAESGSHSWSCCALVSSPPLHLPLVFPCECWFPMPPRCKRVGRSRAHPLRSVSGFFEVVLPQPWGALTVRVPFQAVRARKVLF